jgi:predicted amidohydrolase YtcJ
MRLPTLTGVITRQANDGTAIRLAVMDGRICAVGDRFQNLTIKTITREGVSLAGKEKSWFLKMPEITYSVVAQ